MRGTVVKRLRKERNKQVGQYVKDRNEANIKGKALPTPPLEYKEMKREYKRYKGQI